MAQKEHIKEGEPERSEQEQRDILREAGYIVKIFAPHGLAVVPSDNGGWACGMSEGSRGMEILDEFMEGKRSEIDSLPDELFRPDQLQYGEEGLRKYPRKIIHALLRHEIGHAKRSSYRNIVKGARHAMDEKCLPTTLLGGMNACEDCWMENLEREDSLAGRDQLDANMAFHLPPNLKILKSGGMSKFRQLGMRVLVENMLERGIVTATQVDEWDSHMSPAVKKTFAQIKPAVEQYLKTSQTADDNYKLFIEKIWPAFKQFEDKNAQDELLKRLLRPRTEQDKRLRRALDKQTRRMIEKEMERQDGERKAGQKQAEKEGSEGQGGAVGKVTKWVKEKVLGQRPQEGQGGAGEGGNPETEAIKKLTRDAVKKALGQARKNGELDTSKLSEEDQKKLAEELKRLERQLPQEFEDAKKAAKKDLDKAQAEELKDKLPKGMEMKEDKDGVFKPKPKPTDPEKVKAKKEALREFGKEDDKKQFEEKEAIMKKIEEAKTQEDLEKIEKEKFPPNHEDEIKDVLNSKKALLLAEEEQRKLDMAKMGFDPKERELYEEYVAIEKEVRRDLRWYREKAAEVFPKKTEIDYSGEYYSGPKVKDHRGMVSKVVTGRGNIYQRPDVKEIPKPKIFLLLLIDRSGSMSGQKMRESLKTAILFNELSKEFDIPISIIFYDSTVEEVKTLKEDFDMPQRQLRAKFMRASKKSGSTNIGLGIDHAARELNDLKRQYPDLGGIMLAMTDGLPTEGEDPAITAAKIAEINKRFPVIDLYLAGEGVTDGEIASVEALFGSRESGRTVVVDKFENLRQNAFLAFKKASQMIMRRYQ